MMTTASWFPYFRGNVEASDGGNGPFINDGSNFESVDFESLADKVADLRAKLTAAIERGDQAVVQAEELKTALQLEQASNVTLRQQLARECNKNKALIVQVRRNQQTL
jgi:hypothetical protein